MNLLKEIMGNLVGICFGGFLLWHFLMIRKYGAVMVQEGNSAILHFEIVVISLFILLCTERLIKDIWRVKR